MATTNTTAAVTVTRRLRPSNVHRPTRERTSSLPNVSVLTSFRRPQDEYLSGARASSLPRHVARQTPEPWCVPRSWDTPDVINPCVPEPQDHRAHRCLI